MGWQAPNYEHLVKEFDRASPGLRNSHLDFCMGAVRYLNKHSAAKDRGKWGLNGKRGNRNDLSNDIIDYLNDEVPWGCSIVDIIMGADRPGHSVGWLDQTRRTHELGTVGLWIRVEGEPVTPVVPVIPDPVIPPIKEPDVPTDLTPVLQAIRELKTSVESLDSEMKTIKDGLFKESDNPDAPSMLQHIDHVKQLILGNRR